MPGIAKHKAGCRLTLWGLLLLAVASWAVGAVPPRRVLVLRSYERGIEPFETFAGAFRTALASDAPFPVEFHEITLATALSPSIGSEAPFVDFLSAFGAGRRLDLVVAIGGPATHFVQEHRGGIFTATPLLMAGTERRLVQEPLLTADDAAVSVQFDLAGALESILQLFPETDEIVLVIGRSPSEQFWAEELRRELQPFHDRARLTLWDGLPYATILERAAALPSRSVIFYPVYATDTEGVSHADESALDALRAVASVPLFGLFDYQLGRGIVGGPLIPIRGAAEEAARAAVQLLAGSTPSSVRPPPILPSPAFDWRELERWKIDASRLPPGSAIRFREPTLWEAHRWKILGFAGVLGLEAALIVALSLSLAGRRRAERALRRSREKYALAIDGTNDGLLDWNVRTGAVDFTPRGRSLLGIAPGEAADRLADWEERIHPEDRERVKTALRAHLEGASPSFHIEHRVRQEGGEYRWILARGKVQRTAAEEGERVVGALTDISERKLAEETVRDVSRRLIVAQEEERARLARELHDDLTQRLARLAIDAGRGELAGAGTSSEATMRLLREELVHLSEDVHALSYRLHPSLLEDLGLAEALQVECDRFQSASGIPVDVALREVPEATPRSAAICLFRVAQEALRNVDRHAGAGAVEVRLLGLEGGLQLAVRDDGVGFDPAVESGRRTLGLASMRERVQLAGGELDIESAPGQGTTIVAWVPLGEEEG